MKYQLKRFITEAFEEKKFVPSLVSASVELAMIKILGQVVGIDSVHNV